MIEVREGAHDVQRVWVEGETDVSLRRLRLRRDVRMDDAPDHLVRIVELRPHLELLLRIDQVAVRRLRRVAEADPAQSRSAICPIAVRYQDAARLVRDASAQRVEHLL